MNPFVKIYSLLLLTGFFNPYALKALDSCVYAPTPWQLEKSTDAIKIYTRYIDGWSIKQYKAVLTINASLEAVEKVLRNTAIQQKWSKNTLKVEEIERLSANEFFTYSQTDSPWPATDRDNVVHIVYSYPTKDSLLIDIKSCPDKYPVDPAFVRVQRMQGQWQLSRIDINKTQVIQKAVVDPGGNAPIWLINSFLVNGPSRNLTNLKQYVEAQQ